MAPAALSGFAQFTAQGGAGQLGKGHTLTPGLFLDGGEQFVIEPNVDFFVVNRAPHFPTPKLLDRGARVADFLQLVHQMFDIQARFVSISAGLWQSSHDGIR